MIFGRRRFADLVERQLDMFEREDGDLLRDAEERLAAYNGAGRDEAEELYGDYVLALDAVQERLEEIRDAYAATLDDPAEYERAFERAAAKRFRL